jgi:hypothetical protein
MGPRDQPIDDILYHPGKFLCSFSFLVVR